MQLQNLDSQTKAGSIERALHLWKQRGALRVADAEDGPGPTRYRVVTANGDEMRDLTLGEVEILVNGMALGSKATLAAQRSDEAHFTWQGVI